MQQAFRYKFDVGMYPPKVLTIPAPLMEQTGLTRDPWAFGNVHETT
jgi:hypothetical protein